MFDKIKDIYKDQADDVFIPLTAGIDASLLGMFEINKKGEVKRISDGRILKVTPRKDYPTVYLRKDGRKISYKIHLLLARTFIENPDPDTHVEVDHIDTNPQNNGIENLRKVTPKENRNNPLSRQHSSKAVCQYDIKGNFIKEFSSCKEAYKALGRDAESSSGISKCCKGGSESFEGFKWKYKDENNTDI